MINHKDADYNTIFPMHIKIEEKVSEKIYSLAFPKTIKEKLLKLEENSNIKFNKQFHYLPVNSLKRMFVTHLKGVTEMKSLSNNTDDKQWLIAFEEIDVQRVLNILKVWIEAFYIDETELERARINSENVKALARQISDEISILDFQSVSSCDDVVLFENGKVLDSRGYAILPLKVVNILVGKEIEFLGQRVDFLYSSNKEVVTNPIRFTDEKRVDYRSYVMTFSVQTLPPYNEVYLNIDFSIRRWISRNKSHKTPFLADTKATYIKVDDHKLQRINVKYSNTLKKLTWQNADYKCYNACYLGEKLPEFKDVITYPEKYITGNRKDVYMPFEYGINDIEHNSDSGMPFKDYKTLFEILIEQLTFLSEKNTVLATRVSGSNKPTPFFNEYFLLKDKNNFLKILDGALGKEKLSIEIWYNDGQEDLKNALLGKLENHLEGSNSSISCCELEHLSDKLILENEKIKINLKGFERRIEEIEEKLNCAKGPTISFVVLGNKEEFVDNNNKADAKLDPKKALRVGFARMGRLTQFITPKGYRNTENERNKKIDFYNKKVQAYEEGLTDREPRKLSKNYYVNTNIQHAILDGYRQLGLLSDISKNKTLSNKKVTGVHICNFKNTIYGTYIQPFPIIITCDFENNCVSAYCDFVGNIDIPYWKLILGLSKELSKAPLRNTKSIKPSLSALTRRIDGIARDEGNNIIMFVADGTSRKLIKGLANTEISKAFDSEQNQVNELYINDEINGKIDLKSIDKLAIIRLRVNDEVPDYYPTISEKNSNNFKSISGVFKYDKVFYSLDDKTSGEKDTFNGDHSKTEKDQRYSHRNIIELYPLFISQRSEERVVENLKAVHDLRSASLQYTSQKTVLPLPLHLAQKIEEYII
ncbi:pPIWI_RE module domain-containing protein [Clostridium sp.]|uniref:pPIWI_RE module domain-containing protein n=1 Tax=Clostridium sp. TaxID=1506 RepID=UPI003D6CF183